MNGIDILEALKSSKHPEAWITQLALDPANYPAYYRAFVPIIRTNGTHAVRFWAAPDYFVLGTDADPLVLPLQPHEAEKIGKKFGWVLPTVKLVDLLYSMGVAIPSHPYPPHDRWGSVEKINRACQAYVETYEHVPALRVGHRKDIVLTKKLEQKPGRLALYGWHGISGRPIQPLTLVHGVSYYDYSHGCRFLRNECEIDGRPGTLEELYQSQDLAKLLSSEGPISPHYP